MSNQDFIIVDGLLKKYRGNDTVVEIPEGVWGIGNYAFCYVLEKDNKNPPSEKIEKVVIPNGVKFIGKSAFDRCKNIQTINASNEWKQKHNDLVVSILQNKLK